MAYPTDTLDRVLDRLDERVARVKINASAVRTESLAGPVGSTRILGLYTLLRSDHTEITALSQTPGLATYVQQQKNNPTMDVVAEFTTMLNTLTTVVNWIAANFPKDANGFLLAQTLGADRPVDRTFTTAELAGLRTQLDALIATIA